jgi:spore germination protein GerM
LKEKILGVETSKEAETPSGGRPVDTKEPNVKILDDEGGRRTPQTDLPEGSPAPQDGNFPLLEDEIAALSRTDGQNAAQGTQDPQSATENARVERSLYLMGMNADGLLFRKAVRRQFKVSASPLQEVLTALLGGVTPAEKQGGFDTLIPPGTMLLNARIRGGTAELSFSEEFMFNPYGAEGYLGQITQIVWTVTEFPNITEVQFLVEGQKIPYLGDSIRLGAPISRGMLD